MCGGPLLSWALLRIYKWVGKCLPTQCLQSSRCDHPLPKELGHRELWAGPRPCAGSSEKAQVASRWDEKRWAPKGQNADRELSGRVWAL